MGGALGCVRSAPTGGADAARGARTGTCTVPTTVATACGSVGHVFFEPEGAVTTEAWQYVGEGKGGYSKLQSYSFVGDGNGTFSRSAEKSSCGGCVKRFCTAFFCLVVSCAAGYAAWELVKLKFPETVEDMQELAPDLFDFGFDLTRVDDGAPPVPKEDVSHRHNASDDQPAPVSVDTSLARATGGVVRYMCAVGDREARVATAIYAAWDSLDTGKDGQVTREELLKQKGVMSPQTLELLLDADADGDGSLSFVEFAAALSQSKDILKDEEKEGRLLGVVRTNSSNNASHKVDHNKSTNKSEVEDGPTVMSSWSAEKSEWCCGHWGVGCSASKKGNTASEIKFDCRSGADNPNKNWSDKRKEYCCEHDQVGCHKLRNSAADSIPYDCSVDAAEWNDKWSLGKKDWCCRNHKAGCVVAAKPASPEPSVKPASQVHPKKTQEIARPAQKDKGQTDGKVKASEGLKHSVDEQATCATNCTFGGLTAACGDRVIWSASHVYHRYSDPCASSLQKLLMECPVCSGCSVAHSGCDVQKAPEPAEPEVVPSRFDCNADFSVWQKSWSVGKKTWCCANRQRGCQEYPTTSRQPPPPPPSVSKREFDCHDGVDSWETAWSDAKKNFCCKQNGSGCSPGARPSAGAPLSFDCNAGLDSWTWGWSRKKKDYCCSRTGKGCPVVEK